MSELSLARRVGIEARKSFEFWALANNLRFWYDFYLLCKPIYRAVGRERELDELYRGKNTRVTKNFLEAMSKIEATSH